MHRSIKKANRVLGMMMRRTIISREKDVILKLYKSLVRPHLEYCAPTWNSYLKKDIKALEKGQRRATKTIRGFRDLSYSVKRLQAPLNFRDVISSFSRGGGSHIHHNHLLILTLSAMTYQARILCLWTSSLIIIAH